MKLMFLLHGFFLDKVHQNVIEISNKVVKVGTMRNDGATEELRMLESWKETAFT